MAATLTYPSRIEIDPDETRDLYEDFQGYAELVPVGSTAQSGEAGEGQTIASGTATLTAVSPASPTNPATLGSCTVSGLKLTATITVPSTTETATYQIRWTATTSAGKKLSRKVLYDVKT